MCFSHSIIFVWGDLDDQQKYHLANWDLIARKKDASKSQLIWIVLLIHWFNFNMATYYLILGIKILLH
jgi:hypothetical protein